MGQPQATATKVGGLRPIVVGIDGRSAIAAVHADAIDPGDAWIEDNHAQVHRRVLRSVSRHVIRQAHCSVAVVHDTGGSS